MLCSLGHMTNSENSHSLIPASLRRTMATHPAGWSVTSGDGSGHDHGLASTISRQHPRAQRARTRVVWTQRSQQRMFLVRITDWPSKVLESPGFCPEF
jgi:hypothetical protein